MGKLIDKISRTNMETLCNYHWPGNVRELKNTIERSLIINTGRTLQIELPTHQEEFEYQPQTLEDIQKKHILATLKMTDWCIRGDNGAASILGLKPTTLESRMAKLGIRRPAK